MTPQTVRAAIAEAQRFVTAAEDLLERDEADARQEYRRTYPLAGSQGVRGDPSCVAGPHAGAGRDEEAMTGPEVTAAIERAAVELFTDAGPYWTGRTRDGMVAALDVTEMAQVLTDHEARPLNSPHCACGWRPALSLNDTASDRRQHRAHQAEAIRAALIGADS